MVYDRPKVIGLRDSGIERSSMFVGWVADLRALTDSAIEPLDPGLSGKELVRSNIGSVWCGLQASYPSVPAPTTGFDQGHISLSIVHELDDRLIRHRLQSRIFNVQR
jgi:hypothetical protein